MNGRRVTFLLLHCVWWGHQRTYPWARCEWCLKPGEEYAAPTYVYREPVKLERVFPAFRPYPTVLEPTRIIDPGEPLPERPAIEA